MLKVQEIRELIRLVDQSNLEEFVYEFEDSKIKMKKSSVQKVAVAESQSIPTVSEAVEKHPVIEPAPVKKEVKQEVKQEDKPAERVKEVAAESDNLHKITSPMVGTFYQAPAPDADPYVKVGDKVKKDTIVCIVEAMKLFNEIEAEIDGEIVEVLVKNGQLVEYGQPLFLVKPE